MFDIGQHVGEMMHLHTPSQSSKVSGWISGTTFEIPKGVARGMAAEISHNLNNSKIDLDSNRQAFVVSIQDRIFIEILVLYNYDHRYYLTALAQPDSQEG